ncbi:MAG: 8-oxo-dGTP diphosphatase MutT [Porticoccaceae bacterium]|nr:8-oxo-dGTP diphosphatase MutT [Porticoccaceae bacterium]MDG1474887.1 8-oxo-dGTP diphosphatase MutT [Porticoccaceae bacterium]
MPSTEPSSPMISQNPAAPIQVVAGVIYDGRDESTLLISRRGEHLHQGGFWEFPGGKIEVFETQRQALCRELKEELDIAVTAAEPLMVVEHDYGDKKVVLNIWSVSAFNGTAKGLEGQQIRWVHVSTLQEYQFPAANMPILERLLNL